MKNIKNNKNNNKVIIIIFVGSVVERLGGRDCDRYGFGSKPTRVILLCSWERQFTELSPAWWSWKTVLNYSYISIKLQADSNILASPKAGQGNCLPYVLAFSASQKDSLNVKIK